ncbi:MAG: ROK family protein [Thermohalobaculum sp.]|nr:ROK family protein [Thermohalobaculum sp.]
MIRIGVDLGGTKTEAVALAPGGAVVARERVPTRREDYRAIVADIAALVRRVEAAAGGQAAGIGIGIPGSFSPATGLVRNANTTVLIGQPFDRDLMAALGRPVRIENDANCFALAEARAGAGQGFGVVLGLILGTGAGGGIVMRGEVHVGANRIAGEWGHTPLPMPRDDERPGPRCYCGRHGCLETWISGTGLEHDHARATGQRLAAPDIAARAAAAGAGDAGGTGDAGAQASLARHLDRLGRALAMVVNILDPDCIVLGGGLSHLGHLYRDLRGATRPHVFSDCFDTPILENRLGDSAGVIGAAWLWPEA